MKPMDITSYLAAGTLLKAIDAGHSFPLDYVKSCPYVMSFMRSYKVKQNIEKYFKLHPNEIDTAKSGISYERLIKILSLYRLTLGQARQEELLEYLFRECDDPVELKKLFIDLSPYSKQSKNSG